MSTTITSHSFNVSQVAFSSSTDCFLNIQKRREEVVYKSTSAPENVNLAYVQGSLITVAKNLSIVDRSNSLFENKVFIEIDFQIMENVSGFSIETDSFLITDIFTEDLRTQSQIPLFFQHQLSEDLGTSESYVDIKLLDNNLNPLLDSSYLITSSGLVYSNLENEFDPETGIYDIKFVSYSITKSTGRLERHLEILNNKPVFNIADIDDLDLDTGLIKTGRKVYLIEEDITSLFGITLPTLGTYGLSRQSTSKIELLKPTTASIEDPWFVKVKSGKFLSDGVIGLSKYYLAEFLSQSFNPYYPYKLSSETSTRVADRIIKTNKNNIAVDEDEGLFVSVVVYDSDGAFKFALTSDPSKLGAQAFAVGTYFSNTLLGDSTLPGTGTNTESNQISVSSIDERGGFIVIPLGYSIAESDSINCRYYYSETEYEITDFDFNPLSSSQFLDRRIIFLLKPEVLGSTQVKSLYYLEVNEDGLVVDTDIDFTLTGLDISTVSTSGVWYDRDPALVSWAPVGAKDFVLNCSTEGASNLDDILILGDVYVRTHMSPDELNINDIRVRGGGITEAFIDEAIQINPEAEHFWDIGRWDGKAFPGMASVFIEIPIETLDTVSGVLTPDNIRDVALRHIGHGIYPVIHAYNNYQTTITGVNYQELFTTISWNSGPLDVEYNIYNSADGLNYDILASGLTSTEYTFSGIDSQYFSIVGYQSGSSSAYIDGSIFDIQIIPL